MCRGLDGMVFTKAISYTSPARLGSQGASQEYLLENRSHSVNSTQHLVD